MTQQRRRIAVILFNLGGPDRPEAVRPFLFNLFNDPSIIRLPWPLRTVLATLISRRRAKAAAKIYDELGGGSPLLENTQAQAAALDDALSSLPEASDIEARSFIAMRYWHPMAMETALAVRDWAPDKIVLLPLYPQFSTTTTASSVRVWRAAARAAGLAAPESLVCCYPTDSGFVEAVAALIEPRYRAAVEAAGRARILFSAHGLPEKIVKAGDPYQWQCEQTNAAIVSRLASTLGEAGLDWVNCYQSRVGPLAWIGPSTEDEVIRAGADGVGCVVVPMAFVSEHSETLVELDIEYRDLARERGVPAYERVPTVDTDPGFVNGLARLVLQGAERIGTASMTGGRLCPAGWSGCPCRAD
ncbi:MAG: ferrochelatase [Azospirillaceae bacterium]